MTDADIDYADSPALTQEFLARAVRVPFPPAKRQLTIRLDDDVLAGLKGLGKGYQTRINWILRAAMLATPKKQPAKRRQTARRPAAR